MTDKKTLMARGRHWAFLGLLMAYGLGSGSCSDKYDLDERTPDDASSAALSIYDYLNGQGNYTQMVRLIDDLNQRDVLARTGSKTLFAADDDAFAKFYKNNYWGVTSYEGLTPQQKRKLLFGAMIDNSLQVQALSSTEGPKEGDCMRRYSSLSAWDNAIILTRQNMPEGVYWDLYKDRDSLVVLKDNTSVPLIHFTEDFLTNKRITNDDYNFLFNNTVKRESGDASVNGVQIAEQNIRCTNGFVHKMAEVVMPLRNMADIIASKPNTTVFNHLLNRYSVINWLGDDATIAYNDGYNTQVDSVFELKYFAKASAGNDDFTESHNQKVFPDGQLEYDPGWNTLAADNSETTLQRDMYVMFVPSDDAINKYWNEGAGAALKASFGTWDNVPYQTLGEILKENMRKSLVATVPSKFKDLPNTNGDPLGITTADVDSVWFGCNGAIYLTNRVFTPTSMVSVMYPIVVDESQSVMLWAIKMMNYDAYLNSLNARYSLFLPTKQALENYIDPVSFGKSKPQVLRFHYNKQDGLKNWERVYASVHPYDPESGVVGDSIDVIKSTNNTTSTGNPILNRLFNILDDHVVVGDVEDGHKYYRTKAGAVVGVENAKQRENGMTVAGTYQLNEAEPISVVKHYDQTVGGNGITYLIDKPLVGTKKSVVDLLEADSVTFGAFLNLLKGSSLVESQHKEGPWYYPCSTDHNISVLSNYNYTIYVPTNESIEALYKAGKLHDWEEVEKLDTTDTRQKDSYDKWVKDNEDFLRYHIQDNSLYIGANNDLSNTNGKSVTTGPITVELETARIEQVNKNTKRFCRLTVTTDENSITVKDEAGNERHVDTSDSRYYNLMAREYVYEGSSRENATSLRNSSSVVVHRIDGPLLIK